MLRVLVIGGSGTISADAVDALLAAEHDVVVFNRRERSAGHLVGSVLGREPIIVHVPKELLAAACISEIAEGIYNNVTRFNLAFEFEQFKADLPDFRWGGDLTDPIRAYVARLETDGAFRASPARGIDDALIESWDEALAVFARLAV